MRLGRSMFVAAAMICGAGATAWGTECDPGTASSLGKYLGEVYCRGAFLPEEDVPATCQEESVANCKDAFEVAAQTNCPTANNVELREHLIARCDDLGTEP